MSCITDYFYTFSDKHSIRHLTKRRYVAVYTCIFLIAALLIFSYFFISGKSFVWIGEAGDGYNQHYTALVYFANWMRSVIRESIAQHALVFPTFSFSFGYGADLFTTLQYYVIGDPLALPSVLVPTQYMVYYYCAIIILRLYLAGLAFSAFCIYKKSTTEYIGILAGSLVYVFCSFAIFASVRHPYFSNPMIYLPLLLLGVDKLLKENKPYILIFMVFISAISNFYFFYMLALLTALYTILQLFVPWSKEKIKNRLLQLLKIAGFSALGVILSMALLLPILLFFTDSARSSSRYVSDFLYGTRYYSQILGSMVTKDSPGNWTLIGTSSVTLLTTFLLFKQKKKYLRLKIALLTLFSFLLLPVVGRIFNGFSYATNRWSWAFVFVVAYIFTIIWPKLFELSTRDIRFLWVCLATFFTINIIIYTIYKLSFKNFIISMCIAFIALLTLSVYKVIKTKKQGSLTQMRRTAVRTAIFLLAIVSVGGNAFFRFSPHGENYISEFKDLKNFYKETKLDESVAIKKVDNLDEFFRYSANSMAISRNSTLRNGLSSTQIFWSLVNGNETKYSEEMLIGIGSMFNKVGSDSRTFLEALSTTKYFITNESGQNTLPYGYTPALQTSLKHQGKSSPTKYEVYKNSYALPLGYTYSGFLKKEDYLTMTPIQRQEALLQSVVLDQAPETFNAQNPKFTSKEIPYKLDFHKDGISKKGNSFKVTAKNRSVTLNFEGMKDCETYLFIDKLQFEDTFKNGAKNFKIKVSANNLSGDKTETKFTFQTPKYQWYNNREDFLVNLFYSKEAKNSITITFPKPGVYRFDSIKVFCQPMDHYAQQIAALKEDVLENTDIHKNDAFATSHVTGTITLKQPKILCLSIPYSKGWRAYVDGKRANLMQANTMYMGLTLEPGNHKIELIYETPGMKTGLIISGIGAVILTILILLRRHKSSRRLTIS